MVDNRENIKDIFKLNKYEKEYIVETYPKSLGIISENNILEFKLHAFFISTMISLIIIIGGIIYISNIVLFENMLMEKSFVLGMIWGIVFVMIYKYNAFNEYIKNIMFNILYEKYGTTCKEDIEINKLNNERKDIYEDNQWYKSTGYNMLIKQIAPFILISVIPFIIYNISSINFISGFCLIIAYIGACSSTKDIFGFFQMLFIFKIKDIIIIPSKLYVDSIIKKPFFIKCM